MSERSNRARIGARQTESSGELTDSKQPNPIRKPTIPTARSMGNSNQVAHAVMNCDTAPLRGSDVAGAIRRQAKPTTRNAFGDNAGGFFLFGACATLKIHLPRDASGPKG